MALTLLPSFQGSALERTAFEAPPRVLLSSFELRRQEPAMHCVPRRSLGTSLAKIRREPRLAIRLRVCVAKLTLGTRFNGHLSPIDVYFDGLVSSSYDNDGISRHYDEPEPARFA
jgi:hypothetical protein